MAALASCGDLPDAIPHGSDDDYFGTVTVATR